METVTLRKGEYYLRTLLAHSPGTAIRYGVLTMLHDAMASHRPPVLGTEELVKAARPLCDALDVADLDSVPAALAALNGRPPRKVSAAMRSPELVDAVRIGLDMLGLLGLANRAGAWAPPSAQEARLASPLSTEGKAARAKLAGQLRTRARELIAGWAAAGGEFVPSVSVVVDGRSRVAAARAWQVPMITGTVPAIPEASSSRYPNRLGRTAAVVAYSSMPSALDSRCCVDDLWLFDSLALLVAAAESVSEPQSYPGLHRGSADACVEVRVGEPLDKEKHFDFGHWWTVLDAWGSHNPKVAKALHTAWRLSTAEADVLVWALCAVAARLATGASAPMARGKSMAGDPWPAHLDAELPRWEEGAASVWALMQSTRTFEQRVSWPGQVAFTLDDESSWPWQPQPEWGV